MTEPATYSPLQRWLHWIIGFMVILLIPAGLYMVARYNAVDFDPITTALFDSHKLAGLVVLALVIVRLAVRLRRGVPAPAATLSAPQRFAAHAVHLALYALLLAMPVLGWVGASMYELDTLPGGLRLPAIVGPDKDMAGRVFYWHFIGGLVLAGLIAVHAAAAFYHRFIVRDDVYRRMARWP